MLELIRAEKLSINEISLARVTDDFIGHLKAMREAGEAGQESLAEFLVVASQLLLIKSRSLLPHFQASPEEEESIAELEKRLTEYQQIKALAKELGGMAEGGVKSFSREAYAGEVAAFYPPKRIDIGMLESAFRGILAALPKIEKLVEERIKKIISLEEKIRELQAMLRERVERAFSEVVAGAKEKVEVIVSFLALLELTKQKLITVEQHGRFGDIKIRKA